MDASGWSLIGRVVLTTPPLGPFCRTVGAQSTTQSWNTDSLTPNDFSGQNLPITKLYILACGVVHSVWVGPAPPKHGAVSFVGSAGASALHAFPF